MSGLSRAFVTGNRQRRPILKTNVKITDTGARTRSQSANRWVARVGLRASGHLETGRGPPVNDSQPTSDPAAQDDTHDFIEHNPRIHIDYNRLALIRNGLAMLAGFLAAATMVLVLDRRWDLTLLALPYLAAMAAAWWLLRRECLRAAFAVAIYGVWGSALLNLSMVNGVHGPTVTILPVLLIFSAWVISSRVGLAMAAATTLALFAMAAADHFGAPLPALRPATAFYAATVQACACIAAGVFGYYAAHAVNAQVDALASSRDCLADNVRELAARELDLQHAQESLSQWNLELERRVRERTANLQASVRDLEAFAYSVSHDLRAPLRAIRGYREVLADEAAALSDASGTALAAMGRNVERMERMLAGLLSLASVARRELERTEVDLTALAEEAVADLATEYPDMAVELTPLPRTSGDPDLLRQVLANLLGNAAKYSSRVRAARVEVGWDAAQGACYVRDNGVGFPPEQAERLFAPFVRLEGAEDFEGHGVGLAIVQNIIERHDGRVWAEGRPGHGACFWFRLPGEPPARILARSA